MQKKPELKIVRPKDYDFFDFVIEKLEAQVKARNKKKVEAIKESIKDYYEGAEEFKQESEDI